MSTGPVEQVVFRTAIAAVNSTDNIRVYFQDVSGNIRESGYDNGWIYGTAQNTIAQAKLGTPIAATSKGRGRDLSEIRVYHIGQDDKLYEVCYSSGKGWYSGDLNKSNIRVAPYSKIAATYIHKGGDTYWLRVYVQLPDNTIQEYGIDEGNKGWQKFTSLGPALPGSEIATTSYLTSQLHIRTYFQTPDLKIIEKAFDDNKGWYVGGFSVPNAVPRATLAATSFNVRNEDVSLRVYYSTQDNRIREKGYDGPKGWYDPNPGFDQSTIPGSEAAVINWGSGNSLNLRVYLQNGTDVSGISEFVWNGKPWTRGVAAIPPAKS